jgi:hypothetical protein
LVIEDQTEPFLATIPSFGKYDGVQPASGLKLLEMTGIFFFGGDSNVLKVVAAQPLI